ncbi:MAG: hypothetical protein KI793_30130 [Rivularia sp. (in: Bacteria)]|nr:hypothetical protein [Rivularia sp. MS3]
MSKFQINDIKLDGSELFNDSETFLSELKDSETDEIIGGLSKESFNKELMQADFEDKAITTVYIIEEPICIYPPKPVREIKPVYPICYYPPKPPVCGTKPIIFYPCPVIL